jgi:hypothetical protein
MARKGRYEAAMKAIRAVFSDTSQSLSATRTDLKALRDEIDVLLDAIKNDIRQEEGE